MKKQEKQRPQSPMPKTSESLESDIAGILVQRKLNPHEFKIQTGEGKSILTKQRIVWAKVIKKQTKKVVEGKSPTTKRNTRQAKLSLIKKLVEQLM